MSSEGKYTISVKLEPTGWEGGAKQINKMFTSAIRDATKNLKVTFDSGSGIAAKKIEQAFSAGAKDAAKQIRAALKGAGGFQKGAKDATKQIKDVLKGTGGGHRKRGGQTFHSNEVRESHFDAVPHYQSGIEEVTQTTPAVLHQGEGVQTRGQRAFGANAISRLTGAIQQFTSRERPQARGMKFVGRGPASPKGEGGALATISSQIKDSMGKVVQAINGEKKDNDKNSAQAEVQDKASMNLFKRTFGRFIGNQLKQIPIVSTIATLLAGLPMIQKIMKVVGTLVQMVLMPLGFALMMFLLPILRVMAPYVATFMQNAIQIIKNFKGDPAGTLKALLQDVITNLIAPFISVLIQALIQVLNNLFKLGASTAAFIEALLKMLITGAAMTMGEALMTFFDWLGNINPDFTSAILAYFKWLGGVTADFGTTILAFFGWLGGVSADFGTTIMAFFAWLGGVNADFDTTILNFFKWLGGVNAAYDTAILNFFKWLGTINADFTTTIQKFFGWLGSVSADFSTAIWGFFSWLGHVNADFNSAMSAFFGWLGNVSVDAGKALDSFFGWLQMGTIDAADALGAFFKAAIVNPVSNAVNSTGSAAQSFGQSIISSLNSTVAQVPIIGPGLAAGLAGIGLATGITNVPQDMPAYLHAGEQVLNRNEAFNNQRNTNITISPQIVVNNTSGNPQDIINVIQPQINRILYEAARRTGIV